MKSKKKAVVEKNLNSSNTSLNELKSPKKKDLSGDNSTGFGDNGEKRFEEARGTSGQESHDEAVREENSDNELSNSQNKETNVLEITQNNSSRNKSVSVNSIFNVEDLSLDDEIYTLQCPENFQKKDLINKIMDFSTLKTTLSSKNEVFQMQLLKSDKEFITLAVPDGDLNSSLLILPLEGHIVIFKDVDSPVCEPMDNFNKHAVVFPKDIKVRHPLLGIDWEDHVDLANAAFKENFSFKKKNKKAKKVKTRDSDEVPSKKIKLENDELEVFSPKKKKKKTM